MEYEDSAQIVDTNTQIKDADFILHNYSPDRQQLTSQRYQRGACHENAERNGTIRETFDAIDIIDAP